MLESVAKNKMTKFVIDWPFFTYYVYYKQLFKRKTLST